MIYAQPGTPFSASVVGMPTGLTGTIGVRVLNAATGAVAAARATGGISEAVASSGTYLAQITAPGTPGRYLLEWDSGSVSPTTVAGEDLVVSTSVGANGELVLLFGSTVSYVGPVAASGAVTLVSGDDYATADGRQLKFTDTSNVWPTLTGSTISFVVGSNRGTNIITTAGTVVTGTGSNKETDVALTAAQTLLLTPGTFYQYALVASLADGNKVTLTRGTATVLGQPV